MVVDSAYEPMVWVGLLRCVPLICGLNSPAIIRGTLPNRAFTRHLLFIVERLVYWLLA